LPNSCGNGPTICIWKTLRLQQELERYKKATYGRERIGLSMNQLAQMLLEFAEAWNKSHQLGRSPEAEPNRGAAG